MNFLSIEEMTEYTINSYLGGHSINPRCKKFKDIVKFSPTLEELIEACGVASKSYLKDTDPEDTVQFDAYAFTEKSVENFIQKLPGILFNKRKSKEDPEFYILIESLKKKYGYIQPWRLSKIVNTIFMMHKSGIAIQDLYKKALTVRSWQQLEKELNV